MSITTDRCRARALAERAYIFAYPMLENYRTMHTDAIEENLAPFNDFDHAQELVTPGFGGFVTPNNDTLYSRAWLDLRDEPVVLTVPAIDDRYYGFQLIDMYTHNFDYVGTRTTGTGAGSYLIAGPDWSEQKPTGICKVLQSEGHFVFNLGRTAVNGEAENVCAIQEQYQLQSLSEFLGGDLPQSTPATFPVYHQGVAESPRFIEYFNFLLGQLVPHPSEEELLQEFGEIGIGANVPFDRNNYTCEVLGAIQEGICRALAKINQQSDSQPKDGWAMPFRAFGDRTQMQGRYLQRAISARIGIYGNNDAEAFYPLAYFDGDNEPLNGSLPQYVLDFEAGQLPPIEELGFWSLTLYDLKSQQFVDNEIGRYSIGDRTEGLVYDQKDGSLTIYIQEKQPTNAEYGQSNWLPTPPVEQYTGEFYLVLRLYLPGDKVLNQTWRPPPITKKSI